MEKREREREEGMGSVREGVVVNGCGCITAIPAYTFKNKRLL